MSFHAPRNPKKYRILVPDTIQCNTFFWDSCSWCRLLVWEQKIAQPRMYWLNPVILAAERISYKITYVAVLYTS